MDRQLQSPQWKPGSNEHWIVKLLKSEQLSEEGKCQPIYSLLTPPQPENELLNAERQMHLAYCDRNKKEQAEKSRGLLDAALAVAAKHNSENLMGRILMRLAVMDTSGEKLEEARRKLVLALSHAKASRDEKLIASCLLNLALVTQKENRLDEAFRYGEEARNRFAQMKHRLGFATATQNLGSYSIRLGDIERARTLLEEAQTKMGSSNHGLLSELGNAAEESGDFNVALHYYNKSLAVARDETEKGKSLSNIALAYIGLGLHDEAREANEQARQIFVNAKNDQLLLYTRLNQARLAQARGFNTAERDYRDVFRSSDNINLQEEAAYRLVSLFAQKNQLQKAETAFRDANEFVEQQRQSLNSDDFRLVYFSKLKPLFHEYVQYLASQNLTVQALSAADGGRARALGDSLGENASLSPIAISKKSGRTILYYSLGKRKSFLWVIRPSGIEMRELAGEKEIGALVDAYKDFVHAQRKPEKTSGNRAKLFQLVLEPARSLIGPHDKLLIIPDGPLHSINFETLPSFGEKLYLIEDHEIELACSLRLLKDSTPGPAASNSLFAIGAPDRFPKGFADLPGAKREMEQLRQFFPPDRSIFLEGSAAGRKQLMGAALEKYSHLHFAIHAEAFASSPLDSSLILRDDPAGFRVTAREIAGKKLVAELVTLSACRGAGAKAISGEGLVGLSRAFLQAGAKRVVAGLWNVSDKESPILFQKMYMGMKNGKTPNEALHAAKLHMIHSQEYYAKPYYWGPWQMFVSTLR